MRDAITRVGDTQTESVDTSRRTLLRCGSVWAALAVLGGSARRAAAGQRGRRAGLGGQQEQPRREDAPGAQHREREERRHREGEHGEGHREREHEEAEEVGPTEDLMREHGVVLRVMVIYDEAIRRLASGAEGSQSVAEPLAETARLVRAFIEDYHEKLEEGELFPRFRQAKQHVELVETLYHQHQAGRRITDTVMRLANPEALREEPNRRELATALESFGRMYIPHMGREDTVLFPAVRGIVSPHEFEQLGDLFEDREQELFGEHGFERQVGRVADIEKAMGVNDLAKFTA